MELKVSSPERRFSPADSDPEENEISDDEDDDRNHKHRRREARSQSLERDSLEQVLTRPYRRRNKPFENGHSYGEANSQSREIWRNYNNTSLEKDISSRFERRRPGLAPLSQAPSDVNQRVRMNQFFSGDPGLGRGRGRESGSWSQRDSRFSSVDIASQMVHQGPVPSSLFAGRGMPNISNAQSASWSSFGLVPGRPNGSIDTLHSLGLQSTIRPPMNPSLNLGLSRQRCRDFEERGFCLRGDMCPMEHGVNRIVVEDVQSLSQFNLPVSLPGAHLLGAPSGPATLPAMSAPSSTLMNSKVLHSKSSKPGVGDGGLGPNGAFIGSAVPGGTDVYDPDQPLWTNDRSESSTPLLALKPSKVDDSDSLLDADPSGDHRGGFCEGSDNERAVTSTGTAEGSQNTGFSMWGRMGTLKNRSDVREKIDCSLSSLKDDVGNNIKEDQEPPNNVQGAARQGKRVHVGGIVTQSVDPSPNTGRINWKPSQKAQRTLFVNGIPQKNNKREALLSHFWKFGEIIDIYIPLNSERAFVQFSKREEAEAALKAPDAVMGNRFIKLWWANRDSIPDDGNSTGNSALVAPHGVTVDSVPLSPSVANNGKDSFHSAVLKGTVPHASAAHLPASDQPKPVVANGPKAPPPSQKKLQSLEFLKEELRKKQEMLDQKRSDFRRQLDKLEKQASGLKNDVASEQVAKRQKVGTGVDGVRTETTVLIDSGTVVASPQAEVMTDSSKPATSVAPQTPKTYAMVALLEPSSLKPSIRPLAPAGAPFVINRFKLDNRPTAFKILPPLPPGLANVAALKEHFTAFGDFSSADLEVLESEEGDDDSVMAKSSARISFTTRRSAEKAFSSGNCWKGHNLRFMWLTTSNSSKDMGSRGIPSLSSKGSSDAEAQPPEEFASTVSQKSATSGDGESETLERREGAERGELDEDFQSSSTARSPEKQSP
ncbi:hypothetical protein RJ639_007742 [Escallonia herrerae]|uniref:Zinc finger CCCH domain-containing protein 41 n=1 Tax=Escallonia herrerae TaxID=1293975 RepID=A0AA89ASV8_9ASTE|nr:hypothetical protein RJ639_007742 [Escallonia herrerae]